MEEGSCIYCKNKIKVKGYKPNKKFCSLTCRYEYRKSSGYYKKYYDRKAEENRVVKYCTICENILAKGKSKYCSKQCLYLKLQLNRRAKKILNSGETNLSGLKIVKLNKELLINMLPSEVRAMIENNKVVRFLTPIYYNDN
jgi:Fe-S-cluster-containing dehydrogenase component